MVVRYKAESKCECRWFYKETLIKESSMMKIVHEKKESFYECRLQITVKKNPQRLVSLRAYLHKTIF
jgi:uncharacterized protein YodC (DUF2158 family)